MISGSNLDGLPPPEHLWDLLAAAGGSPMLQRVIFDGFWLPSWVPLGSLFGYFLEKWITFLQAVLQVPSGEAPGLVLVILGSVLGGFWGGLVPGKSCQSVQLYKVSGFGPFWSGVCFRIRFWKGSGTHLGRFGADWGTHWGSILLFV